MSPEQEQIKRKEGFDAFWNDQGENYNNPYPKNTEEYDWFYIGWIEAFNDSYESESYRWL